MKLPSFLDNKTISLPVGGVLKVIIVLAIAAMAYVTPFIVTDPINERLDQVAENQSSYVLTADFNTTVDDINGDISNAITTTNDTINTKFGKLDADLRLAFADADSAMKTAIETYIDEQIRLAKEAVLVSVADDLADLNTKCEDLARQFAEFREWVFAPHEPSIIIDHVTGLVLDAGEKTLEGNFVVTIKNNSINSLRNFPITVFIKGDRPIPSEDGNCHLYSPYDVRFISSYSDSLLFMGIIDDTIAPWGSLQISFHLVVKFVNSLTYDITFSPVISITG
jgi:hypothetical protein